MNKQFRQGDLLFLQIDKIPAKTKLISSGVIVHSDSTQHEHKLVSGKLYKFGDKQYALISKKAQVIHNEHGPITLTKGNWEIRRQKQMTSKNMAKVVVD